MDLALDTLAHRLLRTVCGPQLLRTRCDFDNQGRRIFFHAEAIDLRSGRPEQQSIEFAMTRSMHPGFMRDVFPAAFVQIWERRYLEHYVGLLRRALLECMGHRENRVLMQYVHGGPPDDVAGCIARLTDIHSAACRMRRETHDVIEQVESDSRAVRDLDLGSRMIMQQTRRVGERRFRLREAATVVIAELCDRVHGMRQALDERAEIAAALSQSPFHISYEDPRERYRPTPDHILAAQMFMQHWDSLRTVPPPEVLRRQNEAEARLRMEIERGFAINFLGIDELARGLLQDLPARRAAEARGLKLLLENLTPTQRETYGAHKYFEVVGGASGKTYRIEHGTQQNVYVLDRSKRKHTGLCFVPAGGLVPGDVMLAQKTALELDEHAALRVANLFPVYHG